ncbi:sensor histidine kinase [Ureibacillus chungkukjangi]|uniref:histidine kinase n=1 Tax=Ureibacillus chungkukjangi TaxID=1202712 RepID=A0A318TQE1_9BACL|nr:HAMP domain-containing sensor histidine kinase [Ureibacillus chungkukjangi]PYF01859.1 signal transduction histidine kinase [Ureibacillus chungkukjangi]
MKIRGIVVKFGLIIMLLFLSILIPFAILIDRIFLNVYSLHVNENVNELADKLEIAVSHSMKNEPEFYEYLSAITDEEIVVFNEKGVIISNHVFEFHTGTSIPKEWLKTMQKGEEFERERFDPITFEKYFFVGQPIMVSDEFKGGVLVFSSIDEIHQKMHAVRDWIIISIFAAIILALGYAIFLAKRLSKPLLKMETATREIARGNLSTKVQINSNDEIGSLASAINDLSIELNNYRTNRSELLANISHELRTPISYLKGYAQVIKDGQYKDEEELKVYSGIIEKESERLAKLIEELFELSKMEEGIINLYVQSIEVEEVIESALQKVELKAKKKNISLLYETEKGISSILTDGLRLEQILLNLLENAINYTEKGSISVETKKCKSGICITVEDTGLGIPEVDIPFIFDRFHRVEKSRSRHMGGTGLGLAIVFELVKQLEGTITVESELGKGSKFQLTLPDELQKKSYKNKN